MDRRWKAVGLVVLVVAAGAFLLFAVNRRSRWERAAPAWLDPQQPPDGVASQLSTLTEAQSWAANRCRHMSACCGDQTAGRRVRRTYPGSLAESDTSFIRASFGLGVS